MDYHSGLGNQKGGTAMTFEFSFPMINVKGALLTYCHSCVGPCSERSQGNIHICISHALRRHIGVRILHHSPHMGQWLQTENN